jgi:hypothetical protein
MTAANTPAAAPAGGKKDVSVTGVAFLGIASVVGAENLQSGEREKLHERTGVGAGRSIATSSFATSSPFVTAISSPTTGSSSRR